MRSGRCYYEFGPFRIDPDKRLLLRDGKALPLPPKPFDMLLALVEHRGEVLEKDRLLEMLWPDHIVEEANLPQNISALRKVLGESPGERRYILTVPGRGYRFAADVRQVEADWPDPNAEQSVTASSIAEPARAGEDALEENQAVGVPVSRRRNLAVAVLLAVALLVALGIGFWVSRKPGAGPSVPLNSLAVLPFEPLVPGNRDEALEMGLADSLIAKLSTSHEIVVRPLSSVRRYAGLEQDPVAAGRQLGVQLVLDGSLQRSGDQVRVNARLVRVADGVTLWIGTFDEEFTNLFSIQDAISARVAATLALRLSSQEKERFNRRYTESPEAYRLYLVGRYHWGKLTLPEVTKSIGFFERAIKIDPSYALAYAGLSEAYRSLPINSDVRPLDAFPKAQAAVLKALELDDSLADSHASLGFIKFWFDWDWEGAEIHCKRAVDLNPNSRDAHRAYALLHFHLGRYAEAVKEIRRAKELDPLSLLDNSLEGMILHYAGRDDEALTNLKKVLEVDSFWIARIQLAKVYTRKRMYAEALTQLSKAKESTRGHSETISLAGYAWAVSGKRAMARKALDELKSSATHRYVPPYQFAIIYNGLNEKDQALTWLERAYQERDVRLTFISIDPKWDSYRSNPRFAAILKGIRRD